MKTASDSIGTVLDKCKVVFQGIGCFRAKNIGKKVEAKLEMEADVKPLAQNPRPVPCHLYKPLKAWLYQLVE